MDDQRFDALVKALVTGTSRRRLLRSLGGSALAGTLSLVGRGRLLAQEDDDCPEKVGICHRTGSQRRPFVFIEVCADAVPDHAAHGDLVACPGAGVIDPETCTCVCPLTEDDCPDGIDAAACVCQVEEANCVTTCNPCQCVFTTEGDLCVNGSSIFCPTADETPCESSADCPESHPVCIVGLPHIPEVCPGGVGGCASVGEC